VQPVSNVTEENRRPPPGITPLDTVVAFASRRRLRGAARLRRILRGHHEVTLTRVRTVDGLLFDLDVENVMDYAVLDHGYYEREVIEAIVQSLTPNGVLWDVGGNIGLHAITAKHLRPGTTVVAFEPAPHTAARLIANASLNRVDVQVVTAALADTDGIARLSIVTTGNNGFSSLRPWPDVEYDRIILCPCVRAEALVAQGALRSPTVVKLDVEGLEAEVLSGFGSLLSGDALRSVVFEAPGDAATQPQHYPAFTLLSEAGFTITALAPAHAAEKSVATNFIATKRAG
jgi:FkbM family methyltransferase